MTVRAELCFAESDMSKDILIAANSPGDERAPRNTTSISPSGHANRDHGLGRMFEDGHDSSLHVIRCEVVGHSVRTLGFAPEADRWVTQVQTTWRYRRSGLTKDFGERGGMYFDEQLFSGATADCDRSASHSQRKPSPMREATAVAVFSMPASCHERSPRQ